MSKRYIIEFEECEGFESDKISEKYYDMGGDRMEQLHARLYNRFMDIYASPIGIHMWDRKWLKNHSSDDPGYGEYILSKVNHAIKLLGMFDKGIEHFATIESDGLRINSRIHDDDDVYTIYTVV